MLVGCRRKQLTCQTIIFMVREKVACPLFVYIEPTGRINPSSKNLLDKVLIIPYNVQKMNNCCLDVFVLIRVGQREFARRTSNLPGQTR